MTLQKAKEVTKETGMWIRHTIVILIVMEMMLMHVFGYLYLTNYKVQVVRAVEVISPVEK